MQVNFDGVKELADSAKPHVEYWVNINCNRTYNVLFCSSWSPFIAVKGLVVLFKWLLLFLTWVTGTGRFVLVYGALAAGVGLYFCYNRFESHLIGRLDGVLDKTDYSEREKTEIREFVPMGVFALYFIAWCVPAIFHVYWNYSIPVMTEVVLPQRSISIRYTNETLDVDIPRKELRKIELNENPSILLSEVNETVGTNLTTPLEESSSSADNSTVSWITQDCLFPFVVDVLWYKFVDRNPWDIALSASRGGYCTSKIYLYLTGDTDETSLQTWKTINDGAFYTRSAIRVWHLLPRIPRAVKELPTLFSRVSALVSLFVQEWKMAAKPYMEQLAASDCPYWIKVIAFWLVQ